jgi:uncharacterized protein YqfA (UPF0365 family)
MKPEQNLPNVVLLFAVAVVAVFGLFVLALFVFLGGPWLRAFLHGTPVPLVRIVAMRLRGNSPSLLIDAYIALRRAGVATTMDEVENAYIDAKQRILTSDDLVSIARSRAESK